MPIGAQKYAQVAGFAGTPATLPPGQGPFPATGADATAAPIELRNERLLITAGVARLTPPAPGQYYLVERATVLVIPATATAVAFSLGPLSPADPYASTLVDQVAVVSGVFVYVNDTSHPIYVPQTQELVITASAPGAVDTNATGVVVLQYRVITP